MSYQPYLIADFRADSGIDRQTDPWLTPAKAFENLRNMYMKDGILYKRAGQSVFGQCGEENVSESVGSSGSTNYTHTLANTTVIRRSCRVYEDGGGGQVLRDNGEGAFTGNGTGTIDYDTGDIDVTFTSTTSANVVADYADDTTTSPIRGIFRFKNSDGLEQLVAMDSTRLHLWNTSNFYFFPQSTSGGTYAVWNSTNLVWADAEDDKLWLVDYDTSSGINTWDGTNIAAQTLTINGSAHTVTTARMVFFWEDRIVLLDTIENTGSNTSFRQRARWSQRGNSANWLDDTFGQGGYTDAATNEGMVSARFLGNTLIVFFERSIWKLRYTQNPDLPFVWEQINATRESASQFGTVAFDDYIASFGLDGLYACNGQAAFNIDKKIPNLVTDDFDNDYIALSYTTRDDHHKHALIAYPSTEENSGSNDRYLVVQYDEGTYSLYEQSALCFGQWTTGEDITFEDLEGTVADNFNITWGDGQLQKGYPATLAGGTTGYVYFVEDELSTQDASTWTADPDSYDFEFQSGQLNPFKEEGRQCSLGYIEFLVTRLDGASFQVDVYGDYDTETLASQEIDCTGGSETSSKVWVKMDVGVTSDAVQIHAYLTETQLADSISGIAQFRIHAFRFWFERGGQISI